MGQKAKEKVEKASVREVYRAIFRPCEKKFFTFPILFA
jgi:hypothetical protein